MLLTRARHLLCVVVLALVLSLEVFGHPRHLLQHKVPVSQRPRCTFGPLQLFTDVVSQHREVLIDLMLPFFQLFKDDL